MAEEKAEPTIKDTLARLANQLDKMENKDVVETSLWTKWKFWEGTTRRQIKKNWIQIIYLQDNKALRIIKAPIDENIIMIDNIPHTVDAGDIFLHKRKPTIIQPSWSLKPLSPHQNIKESKDAGNSTLGWEYVMNKMKKDMIKNVKNVGMMMWIVVGLIIVGGGYYVIKSGMFS